MQRILHETKQALRVPEQKPPMSPDLRAQYTAVVNRNLEALKSVDNAIKALFKIRQNEEEARIWFRDRMYLNHQYDFKEAKLRDAIYFDFREFQDLVARLVSVVTQLQQLQKQGTPQSAVQVKVKQETGPPSVSQSPKQANGMATAQARRGNGKAPPAPTVGPGQKSFFPSGVQSPQGVPTYFEGPNPVTDIKMPLAKKQKRAPSASAASPQTTGPSPSPQMGKPPAPKPQQPQVQQPQVDQSKPKPFKCDDSNCEYSTKGFDTKLEMEEHKKMHYVFPSDSLKYAKDSVAASLGLNPDGSVAGEKEKATPGKSHVEANTSQSMARSATKTSPSFSLLKGPKEAKMPAPTSAPKSETKGVQGIKSEDEANGSAVISPVLMNDIFDLDALGGLDFPSMPSTLDSSPSALTPSSSRDSNSSGTREKSSDILEQDKLNVKIAMDSQMAGYGDEKDTLMFSLEDFTTELGNGDFMNLGVFPTGFDDEIPSSTDPSLSMFTDQFTTGENGERFLDLDLGEWNSTLGAGSDFDFDKMLS